MEDFKSLQIKFKNLLKEVQDKSQEFLESQCANNPREYIALKDAEMCVCYITYRKELNLLARKVIQMKIDLHELKENKAAADDIQKASKLIAIYEKFDKKVQKESCDAFQKLAFVRGIIDNQDNPINAVSQMVDQCTVN